MKKFLSILVLTALILSTLSLAVSAKASPKGEVTHVDTITDEAVVENKDGEAVDGIEIVIEVEVHEEHHEPFAEIEDFGETFGEKFADFKNYATFEVRFSEETKELLDHGYVVHSVKVVLHVPGLTADNVPTVVYHDNVTDEFTVLETKVEGSNITFTALPLTVLADSAFAGLNLQALAGESVTITDVTPTDKGYYAIIYTSAETSPSTGVNTVVFGLIFVVALAGAAIAGKKVFSK